MVQKEALPAGIGYRKGPVNEYIDRLSQENGRLRQERLEQEESIRKFESAVRTLAEELKKMEKPFRELQGENGKLKAALGQKFKEVEKMKGSQEDSSEIAAAILEARRTAKQIVGQAERHAMDMKQEAVNELEQMYMTTVQMQKLLTTSRQQMNSLYEQMDRQVSVLEGRMGF